MELRIGWNFVHFFIDIIWKIEHWNFLGIQKVMVEVKLNLKKIFFSTVNTVATIGTLRTTTDSIYL